MTRTQTKPKIYAAQRLISFVQQEMSMSGPYQPLIIAALLRSGGKLGRTELARVILLADPVALRSADRVLMRWPRRTLERRGIAMYEHSSRAFILSVEELDDDEREAVLNACDRAVDHWSKREGKRAASGFYAAIEAAEGRCQACGIPGSERPLDVDHIIPRSRARGGKVMIPSGDWIGVNDRANLQVLCTRCNRGKRDASSFDFRPSLSRLAETIDAAVARAETLGYSPDELVRASALQTKTS